MRDRGQAMVELALLLPVLVFGIAGGADFGRSYAAYGGAMNAARAGAELAVINRWTTSANDATIIDQAQDEMQRIPASNVVMYPTAGYNTRVIVTHPQSGGVTYASVQVQYTFRTIIAWPFLPNSASIDRTVTLRNF